MLDELSVAFSYYIIICTLIVVLDFKTSPWLQVGIRYVQEWAQSSFMCILPMQSKRKKKKKVLPLNSKSVSMV